MLSIGTGVGVTDVGSVPGFWASGLGHFWDENAYNASPNRVKQLLTVSSMAALGYTSSGGTNGTIIGSDGTLQAASAPRITYDRGATSNFAGQSEALSTSPNVALSSSYAALRLTEDSINNTHGFQQNISGLVSGATYCASIFFQPSASTRTKFDILAGAGTGTGSSVFDFSGSVPSATNGGLITPVGNGTYRCSIPLVPNSGLLQVLVRMYSGGSSAYVGDGVSGAVLYGLQLNPGSVPTPYLKTTATAPLYAAGTPKSQNLLPNSDPAQSPWSNDGAVTATTTTGETRIQFSGANQGRNVGITTLVGCVYTVAVDVKPTSPADAGTAIRIGTNSAQSIVTLTAGYQTVYISVVETTSGVCTFNTYSGGTCRDITVRNVRVYEGTAQLPYVATTGTPYSLYYQQGLITEAARTRETLHPRDLTQAAWTGPNMTVTKTGTGIDGVANSCSILTATASSWASFKNQSVTSASANRLLSVWVRAVSGTAVPFRLSVDGGTTYTLFTATPQWQPFMVNKASVTNPGYLIWLQNSGDSIAVDFIGGEQYTTLPAVPPMPIWGTESAAQTKSADLVIGPAGLVSTAGPQTTVVRSTPYNTTPDQEVIAAGTNGRVGYFGSGYVQILDGTNAAGRPVGSAGIPVCFATRYGGGTMGVTVNGGAIDNMPFDGSMGSGGAVGVGNDGTGAKVFSGLIGSIEIANSAFSDANLQLASLGLLA